MKRILTLLIVALTLAAITISCAVPFDMTKNLKNQIITYSGGNNSEAIYAFNATGTAGTFEYKSFTYMWETQALATAALYSTKAWVQTGGNKGTFTYNLSTHEITQTRTEVYSNRANGVAVPYAYSYKTYAAAYGGSGYTISVTQNVLFTQDALAMVFVGEGPFVYTYKYSETSTEPGNEYTYTDTQTTRYAISATGIDLAETEVEVLAEGAAAAETTTTISNITFAVSDVYRQGSTDVKESFSDIWKNGNKATFRANQTKKETIKYTGSAAPTAPAVSTTTGTGRTTAANGTYDIDQNVDSEVSTYNFERFDAFMIYNTSSASRGLER